MHISIFISRHLYKKILYYLLWNRDKCVTMLENFFPPQWGHGCGPVGGTTEGFIERWNTSKWNCNSSIVLNVVLHTLQQCSVFVLAVNRVIFLFIVGLDWHFAAILLVIGGAGGVITDIGGVVTGVVAFLVERVFTGEGNLWRTTFVNKLFSLLYVSAL